MSKTDKIKADLDALGIDYDDTLHHMKLAKLLKQAKEQMGVEPIEKAEEETKSKTSSAPAKPSAPTAGEPEMDPRAGDKTPAVVAWRKKNWTEGEFKKVYDGRNYPL